MSSILTELVSVMDKLGLPVETGVFSGKAPEEYAVLTPLAETFEVHADDRPQHETQEARVSLYSRGSYLRRKTQVVNALLAGGFTVTNRRYVGHEDGTGYHHYAIDAAMNFELEDMEKWQPLALTSSITRQ